MVLQSTCSLYILAGSLLFLTFILNIGGTPGKTPPGELSSPNESENWQVLGEEITRNLLRKYDEIMGKSSDKTQPTKQIQDTIIELIEEKMGKGSFGKAIRILYGKKEQAVTEDDLEHANKIDKILKFAKTHYTWHKRRIELRKLAEPIITKHAKELAKATGENLPKLLPIFETVTYNLIVKIEEDQQNKNREPPKDEVEKHVKDKLSSELEEILTKLNQRTLELRKSTAPMIKTYADARTLMINEDHQARLSHLKSLSIDLILRIEMYYLRRTQFKPQSATLEDEVKEKVVSEFTNILDGLEVPDSAPCTQQEIDEFLNNVEGEESQEIVPVTEYGLMELITPTTLLLVQKASAWPPPDPTRPQPPSIITSSTSGTKPEPKATTPKLSTQQAKPRSPVDPTTPKPASRITSPTSGTTPEPKATQPSAQQAKSALGQASESKPQPKPATAPKQTATPGSTSNDPSSQSVSGSESKPLKRKANAADLIDERPGTPKQR